ncbi:long-chain-fatty-acid--CoA ligase 5 isoform X1 [Neodiprion pinetum]|uniref:long-chain-fatty-acid--CoA ligase 5 isoform X1 n=1 Tax=Neodiprion fabricii TaxID=2872261 RepID=UPI001ED8F801|nr:long-chain-fatty-acid--CoA ligase 5 isoform X1 [Neodiprion fabricii]XP_046474644.1 long-chain-fatty-acid--CoA ligase 5 isoform X1 [Neodiprion pinetum]XP_046610689.1 long-chain-fatty-acid--CoA ligase 5 isoform X1 [Neodiprion virginianus]
MYTDLKPDLENAVLQSHLEEYLPYVGGAAGALVLTGVAAYFASRPTPERPLVPLDAQAKVLPGAELVRVSKFYKDSKDGKFVSYIHEDTRTLYDSFRRGAKESNNGPCLGWHEGKNKPYQWLHYNETLLRARNLGSGLIACGLVPGPQTLIGLYSQNCPEWVLTEQACYNYSLVVVPLYDTLGPDACAYIINQAEISLVVCEDDKKCNLLLDKAPRCLRKLVVMKDIRPATKQRAKNRGVELLRFDEVERLGSQKDYPEVPPRPTDLCTICYTSGTTGNPKGVMLTHQNVVAGVCAVLLQFGDHRPTAKDVMISFLPLAHMLERCCENGMYMVGGAVGFYSGDIKHLTEDMKALKPTVMPAVPRLLNRIYDKVTAELQGSFLKRMLFNMALRAKESEIKKSIVRNNSFWDKVVFKKIQDGMGGRLRLIMVGSAPLSGNVLTFARCVLGCLIVEGYGQTECCAPITLTVQGDHVPEHVGPPVACCCVKLVDVPDMEYYAVSNQGEVCVKGTNVFAGYFKDPEKTAEVIDEQGWHHTGDIGMWLPNGTLKIIDRKKHIFKLSQGEYIVPEKIENIYIRSQYVHQVFVHGESLKSCVVAIVVPDVDVVKCWASENRIPGTLSVLCANPEVKRLILDDMQAWGRESGLKSFEQVKDIYLHPDPFSVQNGLLTPTLKTKRPQLKAYFKPQLEDLYQHLA